MSYPAFRHNVLRRLSFFAGALSLLGASLTGNAQTAPPVRPDAQTLQQIQTEAARAAHHLRDFSGVRDAQGNIVRNADGSVQTSQRSTVSQYNDLEYFKGITGIQGLEQVASPGRGQEGRVRVALEQSFDVDCKSRHAGLIRSAGSLTFKIFACEGTSPVKAVSVVVCKSMRQ